MFKARKEMTMGELLHAIQNYGVSIPPETVNRMTYSELKKVLRAIKMAYKMYEKAEAIVEAKSQPKVSKNT
jgi:hypothetical protein